MRNEGKREPGIYVEIHIRESIDRVWQMTQDPDLHQRWDLRFTRIHYLPRVSLSEPQSFLYETRVGFGLRIRGNGQSAGERALNNGETTSSLKFASEDPKSLIRNGSGYWRYIPVRDGLRFLTWYDYQVRFGAIGRIVDRLIFRPSISWATAWSFDRLRLWAETGQQPEVSMGLSVIHAIARSTIAFVWIWHGLVPKLVYPQTDERTMLQQAGVPVDWLTWIGAGEVVFGVLVLLTWNTRGVFMANGVLMGLTTVAVAVNSPEYLKSAFNPVTLNLAVLALSVVGFLASRNLPSARRCLRKDPRSHL